MTRLCRYNNHNPHNPNLELYCRLVQGMEQNLVYRFQAYCRHFNTDFGLHDLRLQKLSP